MPLLASSSASFAFGLDEVWTDIFASCRSDELRFSGSERDGSLEGRGGRRRDIDVATGPPREFANKEGTAKGSRSVYRYSIIRIALTDDQRAIAQTINVLYKPRVSVTDPVSAVRPSR